MENYYYLNARNESQGPVPANQLTAYGVTRTTKVWNSSMPQWQEAGKVAELAFLFEGTNQAVPLLHLPLRPLLPLLLSRKTRRNRTIC